MLIFIFDVMNVNRSPLRLLHLTVQDGIFYGILYDFNQRIKKHVGL
jgi:hypothetical protein